MGREWDFKPYSVSVSVTYYRNKATDKVHVNINTVKI